MDRKLWTEARAIAARHDPIDREDLAQDLAVRVLEQASTADNPAAWLERVGRNAAVDRWRAETRHKELMARAELPEQAADPEWLLLRRERRQLVRSAVGALPRPQRRAALARFHAELSYDQAAERLGTAVPTARTRVHRALAALRARLAVLRALFAFPGVQSAALGLAVVIAPAVSLPAVPVADVIAFDSPARVAAPRRRLAAARVMAAGPATSAQARPVSPRPAHPPEREPPVQTLTFDGEEVEGDIRRPVGIVVNGSPAVGQPSLIELRRQFVPELLKTLEDL